MAQPSVQGRFIWEGLMTENPAGAAEFYNKVVGWRTEPWAGDSSYTIFAAKSGPVAGMSQLTDALREQGVRGHWLVFIGADDVDATVASAEKLGAKILRPASDINQVGRFAILADPQGAAFAVFKPLPSSSNPGPKGVPQNGEFAWQELSTTDDQVAFKFYSELFGWQLIHRMDMGAMGFYLIFGSDGVQRGGMFKASQPGVPPHWLPYTEVPDADKAAATATKAGGRVLNGPMDVPGGGRIAQLADPSGVAFAVHTLGKSATAPPPPKPAAPKPAAPKPSAAPPAAPQPAPKPAAPQSTPPSASAASKSYAKPPAAPTQAPAAKPKKKAAAKKAAKPARSAAKPAAKKAAVKRAAGKKVGKGKTGKKKAGKKTAGKKKSAARSAASARKSARSATKQSKRGGKARRKK